MYMTRLLMQIGNELRQYGQEDVRERLENAVDNI